MNQLALILFPPESRRMRSLVATPAARTTDPSSSHDAAEHITRNGTRAQQQAQTIAAIRAYPGKTMQELAELTGHCRWMLGRRVSECETAGAVRRMPKRKCTVTGRRAEPWEPA
jgi:predicted transcriptional regulator